MDILVPSFVLSLAGWCPVGWLASVRAINRSASGFPNALVFLLRTRRGRAVSWAPRVGAHEYTYVCIKVMKFIGYKIATGYVK